LVPYEALVLFRIFVEHTGLQLQHNPERRAGRVAQAVDNQLSKCAALNSNSSTAKKRDIIQKGSSRCTRRNETCKRYNGKISGTYIMCSRYQTSTFMC
jgi:hypothetical protein